MPLGLAGTRIHRWPRGCGMPEVYRIVFGWSRSWRVGSYRSATSKLVRPVLHKTQPNHTVAVVGLCSAMQIPRQTDRPGCHIKLVHNENTAGSCGVHSYSIARFSAAVNTST
jgi:hypothetical protein